MRSGGTLDGNRITRPDSRSTTRVEPPAPMLAVGEGDLDEPSGVELDPVPGPVRHLAHDLARNGLRLLGSDQFFTTFPSGVK